MKHLFELNNTIAKGLWILLFLGIGLAANGQPDTPFMTVLELENPALPVVDCDEPWVEEGLSFSITQADSPLCSFACNYGYTFGSIVLTPATLQVDLTPISNITLVEIDYESSGCDAEDCVTATIYDEMGNAMYTRTNGLATLGTLYLPDWWDGEVSSLTITGCLAQILEIRILHYYTAPPSGGCIGFDGQEGLDLSFDTFSEGDVLFTEDGVPVSIYRGVDSDGDPYPFSNGGFIEVNPTIAGNAAFLLSANLFFDFTTLEETVTSVSFYYRNAAGLDNISVNGEPIYAGDIPEAPASIAPGVILSAMGSPFSKEYIITLTGEIQSLEIGGQETSFAHFCFETEPAAEPPFCLDFESLTLGETYNDATHSPGDLILTEHDIEVSVVEFDMGDGFSTFVQGEVIEAADFWGTPIGDGNVLMADHIGYEFDFTNLADPITSISFQLSDAGAIFLNINGDLQWDDGLFDALEFDFGPDISITVTEEGWGAGHFTILGNIETISFGGQFFVIDNICVWTESAATTEVWPGDADNDGIANNFDLLPIGIAYDNAGPERLGTGITWFGYTAELWGTTFADGTDYAHADCDGNGTVAFEDIDAILLNYGMTHGKGEGEEEGEETDPPLYVDLPESGLTEGETMFAPVLLGDLDLPVTDLYGIAFTIHYDAGVMDAESVAVNFGSSWLGQEGVNMVTLSRNFPANGSIDVALVRTDQLNQTGYGEIGTFSGIIDNIAGKGESELEFTITISDVRAISLDESEILLNVTSEVIVITDLTEPQPADALRIYPNPASHQIRIDMETDSLPNNIRLYNTMGQLVFTENETAPTMTIDIRSLQTGVYFLALQMGEEQVIRKIEVVR